MEIILNKPYEVVFKNCEKVLKTLKINISKSNMASGIINGVTESSIWSWGEDVELQITKINETRTRVCVESSANAQLWSWGKDSENERNILKLLKITP